jgi:DUF3040 family protein
MSLSLGERRRLRRIERSLASSDSRLASLYSIFNRVAWVDAMPARERVRTRVWHTPRREKAGYPAWSVGHWMGYPVPGPGYRAYATSGRDAGSPGKHHDRSGKTAPLAEAGRPRHRGGMRRLVSRVRLRGFSF